VVAGCGGGERVQRRTEVAFDADVDDVVSVDLGREPVDVDDLFVAVRVDPGRVELLQYTRGFAPTAALAWGM
jgi:hypothetical protein